MRRTQLQRDADGRWWAILKPRGGQEEGHQRAEHVPREVANEVFDLRSALAARDARIEELERALGDSCAEQDRLRAQLAAAEQRVEEVTSQRNHLLREREPRDKRSEELERMLRDMLAEMDQQDHPINVHRLREMVVGALADAGEQNEGEER